MQVKANCGCVVKIEDESIFGATLSYFPCKPHEKKSENAQERIFFNLATQLQLRQINKKLNKLLEKGKGKVKSK